jgi:hypothetical protein
MTLTDRVQPSPSHMTNNLPANAAKGPLGNIPHNPISKSAPSDRLRPLPHSQGTPAPPDDVFRVNIPFRHLEAKMWDSIRTRTIGVAQDIRSCGKESHPIFRQNQFLPATSEVVEKLLKHPLSVTTAELSQIFRLHPCDEITPPNKTSQDYIPYERFQSFEASYSTSLRSGNCRPANMTQYHIG